MYKIVLNLNEKGRKICGNKTRTLYMDYENNDTPDIAYINDFIEQEFDKSLVDNVACCRPNIIDELAQGDVVKILDTNNHSYTYGYVILITKFNEKCIYVFDINNHWKQVHKFNEFGEECGKQKVKQYITILNKEKAKKIKDSHYKDFLYQKICSIFADIKSKNDSHTISSVFIDTEDLELLYNILKKYDER